jgi:hypothetical protein
LTIVKGVALTVRFGLELAMLAALGYWALHLGLPLMVRVAIAAGSILAACAAWGAVVAPRAAFKAPTWVRLAVEVLIFGSAGFALLHAGQSRLAVLLVTLAAIDKLVLVSLGGSDPSGAPGPRPFS